MKAPKATKAVKSARKFRFKDNRKTNENFNKRYELKSLHKYESLQQEELNKHINSHFIQTHMKRRRWVVDFDKYSAGVKIILSGKRAPANHRIYTHVIAPHYYYKNDSIFFKQKDLAQGTFVLVDAVKQEVVTLSLKNYDVVELKFVIDGRAPELKDRWSYFPNINFLQQTAFYLFDQHWNELPNIKRPLRTSSAKATGRRVKIKLAWSRKSDKPRSQIVKHMKTVDSFESTPRFKRAKESFTIRKSLLKYINWKYSSLNKEAILHVTNKQNSLMPLQTKLFNNLLALLVRVGFARNITLSANLVRLGLVVVNGKIVYNPYYVVQPGDNIEVDVHLSILTKSSISRLVGSDVERTADQYLYSFKHVVAKRDLLKPLSRYASQRDNTSTLVNDNIIRFLSKK